MWVWRVSACPVSILRITMTGDWKSTGQPHYRLNNFGRRCFAVAGPSTWNSLPDSLRDPALSLNMFRRQLKTYFFCEILTRCTQRIRDFLVMRCINLHFTYLLTSSVWCVLRLSSLSSCILYLRASLCINFTMDLNSMLRIRTLEKFKCSSTKYAIIACFDN